MLRSSTSGHPHGAAGRAVRRLRDLMPAGGGLRDEDWQSRHRLLTWTMVGSAVGLTLTGAFRHSLDSSWLITMVIIGICTAGALLLPPRRLSSCATAFGLTASCTGLVMMYDGLIEAHFAFFVAVGALALYRDWVPFGAFLGATVAGHAVMGVWMPMNMYDHGSAVMHPWRWTAVHGVAVLLTAATQVIGWRLTETEESRAQEDLTRADGQFTAAFAAAPLPMAVLGADGAVLRVNPAFSTWLDLPAVLPTGYSLRDLPMEWVSNGHPPIFDRIIYSDVMALNELHGYHLSDGRSVEVEIHASALRDQNGKLRVIIAHFLDVTERRAQEAVLKRQARQDSLTGLLTRGAFEDDLVDLLASAADEVSVIYIDVDRFKAVNDSYGHGAGDQVLRTLGQRLAALIPHDALLARLGGDEFAVALPGPTTRAQELGQAVVDSCGESFPVAGGHLVVTVSVGVSAAVAGERAEAAVQSADLAMYAAKQTGRDRTRLFDDSMRMANESRLAAEHLLREALDGDRASTLPVLFQPIVSLPTRQIIGAEALVRLRTQEGDVLAPGMFIPIAEETGLVVPLGQHVLRTALHHLREWGDYIGYVSVNVSPRQLSEAGFVAMLVHELEASRLQDRSKLVLEITETSILQTGNELRHGLDAIKALGVRLALDDFGTGYSSLTWLQSVQADIVKLDRSFVAGLASEPDKAAIITAVLWLAKTLGMSVVAEGVEDVADADMLADADCPAAQGYLFGRPMRPEALSELLPKAAQQPGPATGPALSAVPSPRSSQAPTIANLPRP